jgi:hypothetical protein
MTEGSVFDSVQRKTFFFAPNISTVAGTNHAFSLLGVGYFLGKKSDQNMKMIVLVLRLKIHGDIPPLPYILL